MIRLIFTVSQAIEEVVLFIEIVSVLYVADPLAVTLHHHEVVEFGNG
jgi:hypothetical protein